MIDDDKHEIGISVRIRPNGPPAGTRYDVRGPYMLGGLCESCGAYLMGGATKHRRGCRFLELIREFFGDAAADAVTEQ